MTRASRSPARAVSAAAAVPCNCPAEVAAATCVGGAGASSDDLDAGTNPVWVSALFYSRPSPFLSARPRAQIRRSIAQAPHRYRKQELHRDAPVLRDSWRWPTICGLWHYGSMSSKQAPYSQSTQWGRDTGARNAEPCTSTCDTQCCASRRRPTCACAWPEMPTTSCG